MPRKGVQQQPKVTTAPQQEPTETKRERFERIGTARMNRVLNSIRLLGNLASPNYDWTEADITLMQSKIVDVLGESMSRFARHKRGEKLPEFRFDHQSEDV